MASLLGLAIGFIAGFLWASPFKSVIKEQAAPGSAGSLALPPAGAPLLDRLFAVPRMDEDALAGVLAAAQADWQENRGASGSAYGAMLRLRMIFSRWTDLNAVSALKAALELKDHTYGDMAVEAVMSEWGLRDSQAASQSLSLISRWSTQQRATLAMVRNGVKRSPADGLATASRNPFASPVLLRGAAGAEWMRRDPFHALRYLFEGEPGIAGSIPAGTALGQWFLEDPAALLTWFDTEKNARFVPLIHFLPEWFTPGRLSRAAAVLKARDAANPDAGLAWLYSRAGAFALPIVAAVTAPDRALGAEMQFWMSARPGLSAPESPEGWLPRARHARMLRDILPRLAALDPGASLKALSIMPPDDEAARLAPGITSQWIRQAPASAASQIFNGDLGSPVARAAASTAVNQLISSDPLKALDNLSRLPLEKRDLDAYRAAAFKQLSQFRASEMLDWLASHPEIGAPVEAITAALKTVAAANPAKAGGWVQSSAPAAERPRYSATVFEVQLRSDRDAALEFLRAQPAGAIRDAILGALAAEDIGLSRRDRNFAGNLLPETFGYACQIGNDTQRLEILRNLLTAMKDTGVNTAPSLAQTTLRAADRAALTR